MCIFIFRIDSFIRTAESISRLDYSQEGFIKAFKEANVVKAIGMGLTEQRKGAFPDDTSPNPMLLDLDDLPRGLYLCPGVNPAALKKNRDGELEKIERIIREKTVAGIKIYAGYYPYYVYDSIYEPVYALAEKYGLPLVIHTGVTYSEKGLLKYSHPLTVDEAAVRFPKNIFVVAHLGDPGTWMHVRFCGKIPMSMPTFPVCLIATKPKWRQPSATLGRQLILPGFLLMPMSTTGCCLVPTGLWCLCSPILNI